MHCCIDQLRTGELTLVGMTILSVCTPVLRTKHVNLKGKVSCGQEVFQRMLLDELNDINLFGCVRSQ